MSDPTVLMVRPLPAQRNHSMERYADDLAAALRQRGDFVVDEIGPRSTAWAGLPMGAGLDRRFARFVGYRRQLKRRRADIYHITDHSYADLIDILPPERTIVTCHDLIPLHAAEHRLEFGAVWPVARIFRWRVARLRRAAHVVCVTEHTREDLIKLLGVDPARTSVIPNGVEARFAPLAEAQRATLRAAVAPPETSILLHLSTGAYKNVAGTLRTLAALRDGGTNAILLRAGRPLSADEAELARTLHISDAVRDLGRVSDERLIELYNLAHVLLFPSFYEGFGWPPLEAMACGTPVVTSEAGALLEVTGDAALHAPADDPLALAAAVRSILEDRELAAGLSLAGLERAAGYSWDGTAAAFAALYRRVLDRAPVVSDR